MYNIKNTNSKGETVRSKEQFQHKKLCWIEAGIAALEEMKDIFDCLETDEERRTLRLKQKANYFAVQCSKYFYESVYFVEKTEKGE